MTNAQFNAQFVYLSFDYLDIGLLGYWILGYSGY